MNQKAPPDRGTPMQLPLELSFRPALGREDYFVTSANEAAVRAIDAWPAWSAPALLLIGPEGSGKTHLAEVWRTSAGARVIDAAELRRGDIANLLAGKALVIEDLPGPALDQTGLFHALNMARETGSWLLLTARERPARWQLTLPDLISRLNAVPLASLDRPDDGLLRAAIIKQFSDRRVMVDEQVVSYILDRAERSFPAVRRLVDRIDRASLARKTRVTRRLVRDVLEEDAQNDG